MSALAHRIATAACDGIGQRARCCLWGKANAIDGSEACMRASCALLSSRSVQCCLCSLDCMRALVQFAVSISLSSIPRDICARLLRGSTLGSAPDSKHSTTTEVRIQHNQRCVQRCNNACNVLTLLASHLTVLRSWLALTRCV